MPAKYNTFNKGNLAIAINTFIDYKVTKNLSNTIKYAGQPQKTGTSMC